MQRWIIMLRDGHAFAIAFFAYAGGVIAAGNALAPAAACIGIILFVLSLRVRAVDPWRRSLRELILICSCASLLGAVLGAKSVADRFNPPFGAIAEHHVSVRAVALERPRPATSGVSVRVRIVQVARPSSREARRPRGAGARPAQRAGRALVGGGALPEMPAGRAEAQIAGQVMDVPGRVTAAGGPRNDGEP